MTICKHGYSSIVSPPCPECGENPKPDDFVGKPQQLTPEYVGLIDTMFASPKERAQMIFDIILERLGKTREDELHTLGPAVWDILCFSTEFLGLLSQAFGDPLLLSIAKGASKWTYNAHYFHNDQFLGPADKLFWKVKSGVQPEQGSSKEDAPVPSGSEGESEDNDIPDISPDSSGSQTEGGGEGS